MAKIHNKEHVQVTSRSVLAQVATANEILAGQPPCCLSCRACCCHRHHLVPIRWSGKHSSRDSHCCLFWLPTARRHPAPARLGTMATRMQLPKSAVVRERRSTVPATHRPPIGSVFTTVISEPRLTSVSTAAGGLQKLEPHWHRPKIRQPNVLPASATACKTTVNSDLILVEFFLLIQVPH